MLVIVLPSLATILLLLTFGRAWLIADTIKHNFNTSQLLAIMIQATLFREANTLDIITGDAEDGLEASSINQQLQTIVDASPYIESVFILDPVGNITHINSALSEQYTGINLSREAWYTISETKGSIQWSNTFFSEMISKTAIVCTTQIGENPKHPNYTIVAVIDMAFLDEIINQIVGNDEQSIEVIDRNGRYIMSPDVNKVRQQTYATNERAEILKNNSDGGSIVYQYGNTRLYASFSRLSSIDWTVLTSTEMNKLIEPIRIALIICSFLVLIVSSLILLLLWRSNKKWLSDFEFIRQQAHLWQDPSDAEGGKKMHFQEFDDLALDLSEILSLYKKSESEALMMAKIAEEASNAKSRFLGNISQEIRNPMNGIVLSTDLLLMNETDREKLGQLQLLKTSTSALSHLMDDVLDMTNIADGDFQLQLAPFSIFQLFEEEMFVFGPAVDRKGLVLDWHIDKTIPPFLIGDEVRIRQVLNRLLSNALKFTNEGLIRVSAYLEKRSTEKVCVNIRILDTGIGMSKSQIANLFQPFSTSETNGVSHKGAALGLAICKRLVDMMGGKIVVESELGKGSSFLVTLCFEAPTQ